MSFNYLREWDSSALPSEVVRYLFNEMTTLSQQATSWVLPSYLRQVLNNPEEMETATEYLIYNLAPITEDEEETRARLSLLTKAQIECLQAVIAYWQATERWNDYCPEELNCAATFLRRDANCV